ncbi:hypothetical protein [Papillibacter cinnamivorans]|uniref:Uncharacterized protein n=1 Tax=Papillibacter cinnamivorans DSM 12816 TaxID=1122930 RepID=A0A1W2C5Q5_9FIRM|nr:hypothetical protein [Papillibacter cinnamivorans]SMC80431.1 hypothetical protein SAMN02745168_2571 [Papillibacter cinnamivorans DSM 12816]
MFIPLLPPKSGYVEVEIDESRKYKKILTEETEKISALESAAADADALAVDQEYRIILLELGVM